MKSKITDIIKKHIFIIEIAMFALVLNVAGITCIIKWLTGISCPCCGMTRAFISILMLDFNKAFYYHPLVILISGSLLYIVHAHKPLFGNVNIQNGFYIILFLIVMIVYGLRLFYFNSDIVEIDLNESVVLKFLSYLMNYCF